MLLHLLELASNKTLAHDSETLGRLAKLQGKTMTLIVKPLDQSVTITPRAEGLEFSSNDKVESDVTLTATPNALVKIARSGMEDANLAPGELEMSGDPIVGQRFAQVIAQLDIDWQTLLSEELGESQARFVTFAASQAKNFADDSRHKFKDFVNQLVTDDMGIVADKQSVDSFLDGVDTVRANADRLMIRIKRLQDKL